MHEPIRASANARLRHPELHLRQFTGAEEGLNGADWEWWIGNDEEGWLALRIQAKKWSSGGYEELTYKSRRENRIQCRVLVEEAVREAAGRALHTLYCFYNGWDETTGWPDGVPWEVGCSQPANCPTVPAVDVFGCALAPAQQVLEMLETHPAPKDATATLPKQRPWSWLFRSPFGSELTPSPASLALDAVETQISITFPLMEQGMQRFERLPTYAWAVRERWSPAQTAEIASEVPASYVLIADLAPTRRQDDF